MRNHRAHDPPQSTTFPNRKKRFAYLFSLSERQRVIFWFIDPPARRGGLCAAGRATSRPMCGDNNSKRKRERDGPTAMVTRSFFPSLLQACCALVQGVFFVRGPCVVPSFFSSRQCAAGGPLMHPLFFPLFVFVFCMPTRRNTVRALRIGRGANLFSFSCRAPCSARRTPPPKRHARGRKVCETKRKRSVKEAKSRLPFFSLVPVVPFFLLRVRVVARVRNQSPGRRWRPRTRRAYARRNRRARTLSCTPLLSFVAPHSLSRRKTTGSLQKAPGRCL